MPIGLPLAADRAALFARQLEQFSDAAPAAARERLAALRADAEFARALQWVWSGSEFAASVCCRQPEAFLALAERGDLAAAWEADAIATDLAAALAGCPDADELGRRLRRFRNLAMLRIVWCDLTRSADLERTMAALSALAEACIRGALAFLHPEACRLWGTPIGIDSGQPQQLLVLAMGKLGGGELNLSSDIDLIFAYPEAGETVPVAGGATRVLDNQEFFLRLGRKLIRALDQHTAEGFVFRVDMRLRPYGDSGALVASFDALAEYYQTQGRDWERYAMIKARAVSGDPAAGARLGDLLRAFTYRKYIDYSAIQALRDMKALINREVARRDMAGNIKLGAGGIREIEFIAQAFQLIRGGRDRRFQTPRLRAVLELIDRDALLPDRAGARLWDAYVFLRNTEHALQAWRDQQTQTLPAEAADRERLASLMGYPDWIRFAAALDAVRTEVRALFDAVVAPAATAGADDDRARAIWLLAAGESPLADELGGLGYGAAAERAAEVLQQLHRSRGVQAMAADARGRLDHLMPLLIAECGADGAETLHRVSAVVEAVARRSVYLTLLSENPGARRQLVRLCAASPWVADELAHYPALLDELLDPATLYAPPDRAGIATELTRHLERVPGDDLETRMEALRYFRRAHALRVAAAEITGALPLMKVSDYLTWLAEAILEEVVTFARAQLVARHGHPVTATGVEPGFLVVGYGKLGGIELAHGSDLDLVFLHDAEPTLATDGAHPLSNEQFFARLGQRVIHMLSTRTASGALYEVDMRLRPSGNSGLLVTSCDAFERYQAESAWVWEQQALVRARPVAGSAALAARFAAVRREVLCRPRERAALAREVCAMRAKMRAHLAAEASAQNQGLFDLKQDAGGIVDIEFMVQFAVLAESQHHPELARWTDNIRILDAIVTAGILPAADAETLREAYKTYRSAGHRLQLQREPGVVPAAEFTAPRAAVTAIWEHLLGG
ncbi:MAG: bifunctional [glutamate--ammonia ligase]-adenylyl-L-tyrosine phosphorylase/[glutamate--ammonia-ligase] adenylyltransferase [Gammaproteobacteria bacterium]|nr:bifunctional [glutamate--ammonia ligase]-adenylyl-L-tyrosine phosphorylase/[glutamate--ammonia-ligase] adenylyltransferase [Gammaproteobacteria bacterium]